MGQVVFRITLLAGIIFMIAKMTFAQTALIGGLNYSTVRHDNLLKGMEPLVAFHAGLSLRFYLFPNHPNLSNQVELLYNRKGYNQYFEEESYEATFDYISMPLLISYHPINLISFYSGFEIGIMNRSNKNKFFKTYNLLDFGWVFGINLFDYERFNLYGRFTYGLRPMLKYHNIDDLGNFNGKINDLMNNCISIGVKVNLHNEKIIWYE